MPHSGNVTHSALANAISVEAAKVSLLGAAALASAASAAPLAIPLGGVAIVGYGLAVVADWALTGRLCPLPVCRKTFGDMFTLFGAVQGGQISEEAQHLLDEGVWLASYESRPGLEVMPSLMPGAMAQVLGQIEDYPAAPRTRAIEPVKTAEGPTKANPVPTKTVKDKPADVWDDEEAEEAMNAIARSFSPPVAQEAQSMEQRIQSMNRNEQHAGDAAIRIRESFRDDPSKLHRGLPDVVTEQRNCVIYGNPGTGKGVQLSNAIRELKRISPDMHVFAIDPKNDPKEDGYWEVGYDTLRRKDILRMRPNAAAEWVYKCVEEFQMMEGPRLLIWDEVMTSVAAFKSAKGEKTLDEKGRFTGEWVYRPGKDLLDDINFWATGWVSSGDSRSIRAWFITQSGNLDDLPFNGGTKTQLRQIILARDTDEQLVGKMGENKTLRKGQADMNVVIQACQRSPVSRAIYVSDIGAWMPLAKLPILCGWNRDEGKSIS